jgi:hypothetical protein
MLRVKLNLYSTVFFIKGPPCSNQRLREEGTLCIISQHDKDSYIYFNNTLKHEYLQNTLTHYWRKQENNKRKIIGQNDTGNEERIIFQYRTTVVYIYSMNCGHFI